MELAQDELGKAAAAGVSIVCLNEPTYPAQLKQIYDPPLVLYMRGNVTNKNSWGPNTLIKQGAKLTATSEDIWEELPTPVRLALTPATPDESQTGKTASLSGESELPPHERKISKLLKADEATHNGEIVELLELDLWSSEIFAACSNWIWRVR